jgi:outer membrane biosynthesis protein TonB
MSVAGMTRWSLRLEQAESSRLAWAFTISLALHLLVAGTYYGGRKYHLWENLHWPSWLRQVQALAEALKKKVNPQVRPNEAPLMFVDVSPAQATVEAPKEAKFYSDKNSRAANPDSKVDSNIPRIDGKQKDVPKAEDIPRKEFAPLQPARPVQAQEAQPEIKAKPVQAPGDLTMAKPEPTPRQDQGEARQARPRTVQEAKARQQSSRIPSQKMNQEGGVKRHLEISSFDAKATPFGAYDAALVEAISQRWFSLLDQRDYASDGRGKVVLHFTLHYDGRITDMDVAESTVVDILSLICQKAVLDPAPFAVWPDEMRRIMGETRNIQFTFFYN